jgi:hypothetical protein
MDRGMIFNESVVMLGFKGGVTVWYDLHLSPMHDNNTTHDYIRLIEDGDWQDWDVEWSGA